MTDPANGSILAAAIPPDNPEPIMSPYLPSCLALPALSKKSALST